MINFKIFPYFQIKHHFNWAHYTVFIWEKVTWYIFSWRTKITSEAVILKVILKVAVSILMTVRASGYAWGLKEPSHISQIHPWALKPQLTLACMDWCLKHSGSAKGHIRRILRGRLSNFLGKAHGWKWQFEGRKEGSSTVPFPHPVCITSPQLLPQFILYSHT